MHTRLINHDVSAAIAVSRSEQNETRNLFGSRSGPGSVCHSYEHEASPNEPYRAASPGRSFVYFHLCLAPCNFCTAGSLRSYELSRAGCIVQGRPWDCFAELGVLFHTWGHAFCRSSEPVVSATLREMLRSFSAPILRIGKTVSACSSRKGRCTQYARPAASGSDDVTFERNYSDRHLCSLERLPLEPWYREPCLLVHLLFWL